MKLALAFLATTAAALSMEATTPDETPPPAKEIAPARDGNIAIQEELDAARKARTVTAYDLFIARHPGHPLETVAREERARLRRRAR